MPLSDEDKALFRDTMKTVKPLHNSKPREPHAKPERKPLIVKKTLVDDTPRKEYYLSNHYNDPVNTDSTLTYVSQSIPRKRLRELKSGYIQWDARLDLHGLRADDARNALCQFIDQQTHNANRCLLIIHGKGSRFGEEPVLKNHVNHWLQQLPQVLAFHSALPRDGGNGAVYVLLKRQRE